MEQELESHEPIAGRLERTREFLAEDLRYLHELDVLKLPQPDRNYVTLLSKRDMKDRQTSNRARQEEYLRQNLSLNPEDLVLPDGTKVTKSLVVDSLFSWIAAAHALEALPDREPEIVEALNSTIRIQDEKRKLVESGAVKEFTQHGLEFFRMKRSLPSGALKVMWKTLEVSLLEKKKPASS